VPVPESGRAGSLEALGGRDGLRGAVVPEELHIAEARARKAVAAAEERIRSARKSGNFKEARAAREAVDEARTALFDVQNRIRREAKRAANVLYPTVKSLAEIQATLREDEAFVAYGLFRRSLALVVRSDGARVVALPDGEEIEAACRALALHDRDKDGAEAVAMLREDVAAPLKIEESVKRILLSPHGALAYVPGALLFPDREVAHLPSGTTYLHLREHGPAAGTKVLALGDPDYKSKEEGGGFRKVGRTRLKPLPATRAEVEAVGSVKLLGASATEAGVREALAGEECWRAVHFACHGLLNAEHPRLSALAVTESGEDDGLLTVLETFYEHHGAAGHEIVFVFETSFADPAAYDREEYVHEEDGLIGRATWIALADLQSGARSLVPAELLEVMAPRPGRNTRRA